MLSKKRRVTKKLFSNTIKKSESFYGENMSLRVFSIKHLTETKFSFVVSKKVSNKANERNLLKRRGYCAIKNISKPINNGFTCIFFFRKNTLHNSYIKIEKEIISLLKKAKVIN